MNHSNTVVMHAPKKAEGYTKETFYVPTWWAKYWERWVQKRELLERKLDGDGDN